MAYMSQEQKKELAPGIKAVCAKYKVKASLGVHHHSTLVLNITSSPLDLLGQFNAARKAYIDRENSCRAYQEPFSAVTHFDAHGDFSRTFSGKCLSFLKEVHAAMNVGNFDKSDLMTDYFHVGWYTDINVGKWDKPYVLEK